MNTTNIDALLEGAVARGAVPGVVAVVGDRDGTLYERAFGTLGVTDERPARTDTVFLIASMTKAIASVAALQLLEQGRLELEQPVADILPEFAELQVLDGFDGDEPRLRPPARQATIRNLLTHTSGLGYWFSNADLLRYHQLTGLPDPTSGRREMFKAPLIADPGTRWEYGTSVDWLGQVIEQVSGQDLNAYCHEYIFGPLGMNDSTFVPTEALLERVMTIHSRTPAGTLAAIDAEQLMPAEPEFFSGGAGAASTGPDYLRFMRALLRGGELDGERILGTETVELAFTDHLDGLSLPEVMRSAIPELTNDVPAMPFRQGFGLGLHLVFEDIPGMRHTGTGDWAGLFNCYYWIDRATGVAGAFLTQVLPFFDPQVVEASLGFEAAVYAVLGAPAAA
jgi:CubicO group peptidase (beta-lactamase class C family)